MVGSSQEARTTASRVVIAIVVALGLLGVVGVTIFIIQEAEARGCINPNAPGGGSIAANASKGRCAR
jgi:hypothetical protein